MDIELFLIQTGVGRQAENQRSTAPLSHVTYDQFNGSQLQIMRSQMQGILPRITPVTYLTLLVGLLLFGFVVSSGSVVCAQSTPGDKLRVPDGFKAELLYTVPA